MRARPTRTISVTATPINIRKTPSAPNDVLAAPVTYATLRYPGGGETIELLGGNPFAQGRLTFVSNPIATETIVINGVTFTFVAGASTATNVHIGDTKEETARNLSIVLNASVNGAISVATYKWTFGQPFVDITYDTAGTGGNAFTLANSSGTVAVTRSAATLEGGQGYGDGMKVDADADFNDIDQSIERYAVASGAGPTLLEVTDWEA